MAGFLVERAKLANRWQNTIYALSKSFPPNPTEEESEEEAPPPKKTPAKATPAKSKKAPAKAEESDDDDEDDDDDDEGKTTFWHFVGWRVGVFVAASSIFTENLSNVQKSQKKRLHHLRKQPNLQLSLLQSQPKKQQQRENLQKRSLTTMMRRRMTMRRMTMVRLTCFGWSQPNLWIAGSDFQRVAV